MKHILLSTLLAVSTFPTPVIAENYYASVRFSTQSIDLEDTRLNTLDLVAGYRLNEYFSIAGSYGVGINDERRSVLSFAGQLDIEESIDYQTSLVVKSSYELIDNLSIYALAGYSDSTIESTSVLNSTDQINVSTEDWSATGAVYGLGLSYEFSNRSAAILEYRKLPSLESSFIVNDERVDSSLDWDSIGLSVVYFF